MSRLCQSSGTMRSKDAPRRMKSPSFAKSRAPGSPVRLACRPRSVGSATRSCTIESPATGTTFDPITSWQPSRQFHLRAGQDLRFAGSTPSGTDHDQTGCGHPDQGHVLSTLLKLRQFQSCLYLSLTSLGPLVGRVSWRVFARPLWRWPPVRAAAPGPTLSRGRCRRSCRA
jgi:hypothetical protein